jgi:Fe2+-dicitrate sensor, membrane component
MDPLIINKVLSKNASPDEAHKVAEWFATDEGQECLSQRFDRESYLLNENIIAEWSDHEIPSGRMNARFVSQLKMRVRTFRFKIIAAVLLPLVVLAGALAFVSSRSGIFASNDMAEIVVPYGEQIRVILQDGTLVQLNSGSRFQYPKSFGLFNRKVKLTGEAYFSVAKEYTRPFIVNLHEINIKVTGTKFNTKAYQDDNKIIVSLDEGSVRIIDKMQKTYPLKVGQDAVYDKISGTCAINKMEDATQHRAWKTKSLNFYRTPLREILKTLERQYDVQFIIRDPALLEFKFSISTSKVNTKDILSDLEKVSNIRFCQRNTGDYEVTQIK